MSGGRLGLALVVCAPSGTGKTTLVKRLLAEFPNFAYSVSYTTRTPRAGEVHGRDYFFVDEEEFVRLREADFFAEWAQVHGNYYGTPLAQVLETLASGRDMLFDIDVQGARQLRSRLTGLYVFILPPSRRTLEERLQGRGTDTTAVIERRLHNAGLELHDAPSFDIWIVNDDLERASAELRAAYLAEGLRPRYRPDLLDALLAQWAT